MSVKKKYEFTGHEIRLGQSAKFLHHNIGSLKRIRALRDFGKVKAGNLGGYIEHEGNLSHEGDCWVDGSNTTLYGGYIYGDAKVYGCAEILDHAYVYDQAQIYGNAVVYCQAKVSGNAHVYGRTIICENACVCGDAWIDTGVISGRDLVNSSKKKHELTDDIVDLGPCKVYRIRALRSFGKVKKAI
ncbi:hypothetical protein [Bartonella tribocorum]|uniref:hypothetical protein n=1 Tax=Bartonella tribocorum TaxID=85701 RepID=UPI001FDF33B0|nr:hypothetical protein [Bartonella tribocorum]